MPKICFLIPLVIALFLTQAYAATKYLSPPVTSLFFNDLTPSLTTVKVMKVIDPLTFIGEDKNVYALAGIEVPNAQTGKADITREASTALAKLIEGKELKIYQTKTKDKGRLNRMNQSIVYAELKQDHLWVQGEMLAMGLARAKTTSSNTALIDQMLKAENDARENRRGLWANNDLQILSPDTASQGENSFGIVEGTPKSASVTRNMIFLNYGDDWKTDFTVGIPSGLRIEFSKKGVDPQQLAKVKIRVRGYIQSYNGAFMELDHPEQIEILDRKFQPVVSTIAQPAPSDTGMRTISLPKPPTVEKPTAKKPEAPLPETPEKPAIRGRLNE